MKRTERQLANLKQKIADVAGLSPKGPGKRAKRWKAAAAKYETRAMGAGAAQTAREVAPKG